jgi:flavin reductase (DIM6/NTAB) family NADH-FMN oxidoreductase RutF
MSYMPLDGTALRQFASCFATGVAVITTRDKAGKPFGLTMSAITSLSLDPALFLICVDKRSNTLQPILDSRAFAINILAKGQETISNTFAGKSDDKFAKIPHHSGEIGMPVIDGVHGAAEFSVHAEYPGGDHVIIVGEVRSVETSDVDPLLYFRGKYGAFAGN